MSVEGFLGMLGSAVVALWGLLVYVVKWVIDDQRKRIEKIESDARDTMKAKDLEIHAKNERIATLEQELWKRTYGPPPERGV